MADARFCLAAIAAAASFASCGRPLSPQEEAMRQIESEIVLPPGARSLTKYARYYAPDDRGVIWGSYTPEMSPDDVKQIGEECRRYQKAGLFAGRSPPFQCAMNGGPARLIKSGQRLWIANWKELPSAAGGGCGYVTFEYDPKTRKFSNLTCNGSY